MDDEKDTLPAGATADKKDTLPAGDTADAKDKAGITVPKARLDHEISKRKAAEEQLDAYAKELEAEIPEKFRDLVPTGLGAADRIKWMRAATARGIFTDPAAAVPATDNSRARTQKPAPSVDAMSAAQKMASGYGRKKG